MAKSPEEKKNKELEANISVDPTGEAPEGTIGLPRESLMRIGSYIIDGLSEDEACIMEGIEPEHFREQKKRNKNISMFLEKKKIEFKHKHLITIKTRSTDKNSQWLLENLRPAEFGVKKKVADEAVDVVGKILKEIQQNNHNIPIKIHDAEYKQSDGGSPGGTGKLSPGQVLV